MWTKEDEECFCITLDTLPQFSKIRVDGFMIGRRYVELNSLSNLENIQYLEKQKNKWRKEMKD